MKERESTGRQVAYELSPQTTGLIGIDLQLAFGDSGFERVPRANAAVANFKRAAKYWRAAGGRVVLTHMTYTVDIGPTGNMIDFAPDISYGLAEWSAGAAFYDGVSEDQDLFVRKTHFSAVASSDLLDVLDANDIKSVAVGGLTTPICVQTTVDGLSTAGIKVAVVEDACASQAIGTMSADATHDAAIQRMGYLFAQVTTTDELLKRR